MVSESRDGADIYRLENGIPLPKLDDIRPHLHRLAMEAALNGLELAQISRVLWTTSSVVKFSDLTEKDVSLRRLDRVVKVGDVTRRDSAITNFLRGTVISPARRHQPYGNSTTHCPNRSSNSSAMDQYAGKDAKYLSETIVTIRDERYVIPVAQSINNGSVALSTISASGRTLFIEPQAVVGLNNRLRQNQIDERHEEQRILAELTALLEPYQQKFCVIQKFSGI